MLRVLTLATLFPDATRPNFGVFVERQTLGLAAREGVELRVVAPVGLPIFPLDRGARFAPLRALPLQEAWRGVATLRPRFRTIPGTGGRWHAIGLSRALRPVLDRLRNAFPFDVIDAEFFYPDGPAAVALGRRYGVPVSIKARGADVNFWGRNSATARHVVRAGCAAGGLLAVSHALAGEMAALGMPRDHITVHHTGIDRARFHPRDRAAGKAALGVTGPLVLSIGALVERKGHDIVIDAVARLPGVQLRIAGEGPWRPALECRIAQAGLADRVELLGPVPHHAMGTLVAAADVMALASESEGLANAWVESLASGVPIVVPAIGGADEVVTSPAAGRIMPRTAAGFAAGIAELLADPPAPGDCVASVAGFSWERNAEALHAHLAGLVATHRGARGS